MPPFKQMADEYKIKNSREYQPIDVFERSIERLKENTEWYSAALAFMRITDPNNPENISFEWHNANMKKWEALFLIAVYLESLELEFPTYEQNCQYEDVMRKITEMAKYVRSVKT